jgi:hypothetical protein
MWQISAKQANRHPYLQDNDYIYFASSFKEKGTMTVEEHRDSKVHHVVFTNKHSENEY